MSLYTACFRGSLPYFGILFRKLIYIYITKKKPISNMNGYGDKNAKKKLTSCNFTCCAS